MLREGLAQLAAIAGWTLGDSETAIQPLIVGDNGAALALSATLEADGIRVGAIRPPTVPEGTARLRITLSAAHTEDDVRRLLDALSAAVAQREVA
ncbi:8-amino-7-oxononanoate synthase [compost metagenome]